MVSRRSSVLLGSAAIVGAASALLIHSLPVENHSHIQYPTTQPTSRPTQNITQDPLYLRGFADGNAESAVRKRFRVIYDVSSRERNFTMLSESFCLPELGRGELTPSIVVVYNPRGTTFPKDQPFTQQSFECLMQSASVPDYSTRVFYTHEAYELMQKDTDLRETFHERWASPDIPETVAPIGGELEKIIWESAIYSTLQDEKYFHTSPFPTHRKYTGASIKESK